jgi:hypothetical protein
MSLITQRGQVSLNVVSALLNLAGARSDMPHNSAVPRYEVVIHMGHLDLLGRPSHP